MAAAAFRKQNPALLIQTVCRCVRFHDAQPTVISIGIFRRVIIIGIGLLGVCTVRKQDDLSARIIDGVQGKFQVKVQVLGDDILGQRSSTVPLLPTQSCACFPPHALALALYSPEIDDHLSTSKE